MATLAILPEFRAQSGFRADTNTYFQESITVEGLIQPVPPVEQTENCLKIVDRFVEDKTLYAIAVVDENSAPVGIVDRANLIELFIKPYARDLNHKKAISAFMDPNPIVVDKQTNIDDLSQIIIDEGLRYAVNVFIATGDSRYLGTGTALDLLKAMTRRKQQQLFSLAHYDPLTQLPNRLLFHDRLRQACSLSLRTNQPFALMFIDLDRFKEVNDTFGHSAGDYLLKITSLRLLGCIRESDTLARLGGDEFVAILQCVELESSFDRIVHAMMDAMRQPITVDGNQACVSLSIGIAIFPRDANNLDELVENADAAMYQAKQSGRDRYVAYSSLEK